MCYEEGGEVYHVNPHDRRARRRACLAVGGTTLFPAIERRQRDFGCLFSMPFCKLLIAEPDGVSRGSSIPGMRQLATSLLELTRETPFPLEPVPQGLQDL